jgi:hypothetical protein
MTLVMFFGAAWGYVQLLKLSAPPGHASALPAGGGSLLSNSTALLALAALVVTAVLAGVLAVVRWISPLASGLPGLLLLAWTAFYFVSVRQAVRLIPLRSQAFGAGWEGLLFNGVLGAAGAVMVFPLFIPSRWHLSRRAEADAFTRDVDEYLSGVTKDSGSRQERDAAQEDDQSLVGTVISRPAGTMPAGTVPVDTTRVTGASRALRSTGSFRMATGAQPRATGSMPSAPRASRSFRRPTGGLPGGLPRGPYDEPGGPYDE